MRNPEFKKHIDVDLRNFVPGKKRMKSVAVGRDNPDETKESPIYRNIHSKDKLVDSYYPGVHTLDGFLDKSVQNHPNNVFFQWRNLLRIEKKPSEHGTGVWQTFIYEDKISELTYAEVDKKVDYYAKGIKAFFGTKPTDRFGIYENTCPGSNFFSI